jgi:hypothetical protein
MAELHAVPPPGEPDRRREWTPERYRRTFRTIAMVFAVLSVLTLVGLLPASVLAVLAVVLLGFGAVATAARIRQLNRDRREWP